MRRALLVLLALTAVCAALPAAAQAQATRTWVSGTGDDVNPCSRTASCKTFAGAISKTARGGEINALDSAGYGSVTITKSMTIDGAGAHTSILNNIAQGVIINTLDDPNAVVTLRNLSINGGGDGTGTCAQRNEGTRGINIVRAGQVKIENVVIQQQAGEGIRIVPNDSSPDVFVNRADIQSTCGPAILAQPGADRTTRLTVRDSTIFNTGGGVQVADRGAVWLTGSTIFDNTFGLRPIGTGTLTSYGDNEIHDNGTGTPFVPDDGQPTTDLTPRPETVTQTQTVTAPPTTVPGPTTTVTVPGPPTVAPTIVLCRVPKLTGLTRATATARLRTANCAVGRVTTRRGKRTQKGKVLATDTKVGTKANRGEKVALVLGR